MKFALPKFSRPLPKFKAPKLRLSALRGQASSRKKFGWPKVSGPNLAMLNAGMKRARLIIGAGALGLVGLGVLGWLVVRPMVTKPQAAAAETSTAPVVAASEPAPARASVAAVGASGATGKPESAKASEPLAKDAGREPGEPTAAPSMAPSEPEQLVRGLQDLEERVAAGDPGAYAEMPRRIRSTASRFLALPRETWAEKRNARALALFLLSGGSSALGRKIYALHTVVASEEGVVKGAIAYLDGIDCAERDALLNLDPRALDVALGAQMAFVQSILMANYDRAKAIARLDLTRLLAPGGLLEEAALRREVGLLSETAQFDKFAELSGQYWSRFRRSPYAGNFLRQFVAALARESARIKVEQWAQLDELIDSLSVEQRRALYLVMAHNAAIASNSAFADLAARRALALAPPDGVDLQRALLYRAAANVADPTLNGDLLHGVDRAKLPMGDQPLFDAVSRVLAGIHRAPEQDFSGPPPGAGDLSGGEFARTEADLREADATLAAAQKSMEANKR